MITNTINKEVVIAATPSTIQRSITDLQPSKSDTSRKFKYIAESMLDDVDVPLGSNIILETEAVIAMKYAAAKEAAEARCRRVDADELQGCLEKGNNDIVMIEGQGDGRNIDVPRHQEGRHVRYVGRETHGRENIYTIPNVTNVRNNLINHDDIHIPMGPPIVGVIDDIVPESIGVWRRDRQGMFGVNVNNTEENSSTANEHSLNIVKVPDCKEDFADFPQNEPVLSGNTKSEKVSHFASQLLTSPTTTQSQNITSFSGYQMGDGDNLNDYSLVAQRVKDTIDVAMKNAKEIFVKEIKNLAVPMVKHATLEEHQLRIIQYKSFERLLYLRGLRAIVKKAHSGGLHTQTAQTTTGQSDLSVERNKKHRPDNVATPQSSSVFLTSSKDGTAGKANDMPGITHLHNFLKESNKGDDHTMLVSPAPKKSGMDKSCLDFVLREKCHNGDKLKTRDRICDVNGSHLGKVYLRRRRRLIMNPHNGRGVLALVEVLDSSDVDTEDDYDAESYIKKYSGPNNSFLVDDCSPCGKRVNEKENSEMGLSSVSGFQYDSAGSEKMNGVDVHSQLDSATTRLLLMKPRGGIREMVKQLHDFGEYFSKENLYKRASSLVQAIHDSLFDSICGRYVTAAVEDRFRVEELSLQMDVIQHQMRNREELAISQRKEMLKEINTAYETIRQITSRYNELRSSIVPSRRRGSNRSLDPTGNSYLMNSNNGSSFKDEITGGDRQGIMSPFSSFRQVKSIFSSSLGGSLSQNFRPDKSIYVAHPYWDKSPIEDAESGETLPNSFTNDVVPMMVLPSMMNTSIIANNHAKEWETLKAREIAELEKKRIDNEAERCIRVKMISISREKEVIKQRLRQAHEDEMNSLRAKYQNHIYLLNSKIAETMKYANARYKELRREHRRDKERIHHRSNDTLKGQDRNSSRITEQRQMELHDELRHLEIHFESYRKNSKEKLDNLKKENVFLEAHLAENVNLSLSKVASNYTGLSERDRGDHDVNMSPNAPEEDNKQSWSTGADAKIEIGFEMPHTMRAKTSSYISLKNSIKSSQSTGYSVLADHVTSSPLLPTPHVDIEQSNCLTGSILSVSSLKLSIDDVVSFGDDLPKALFKQQLEETCMGTSDKSSRSTGTDKSLVEMKSDEGQDNRAEYKINPSLPCATDNPHPSPHKKALPSTTGSVGRLNHRILEHRSHTDSRMVMSHMPHMPSDMLKTKNQIRVSLQHTSPRTHKGDGLICQLNISETSQEDHVKHCTDGKSSMQQLNIRGVRIGTKNVSQGYFPSTPSVSSSAYSSLSRASTIGRGSTIRKSYESTLTTSDSSHQTRGLFSSTVSNSHKVSVNPDTAIQRVNLSSWVPSSICTTQRPIVRPHSAQPSRSERFFRSF